jgi:microcystin-dependent protein
MYGTFVQIGTVQILAGTPDSGWLVCDGSAVSRSTYARLFAVIGTSFGAGDGSTTFNLPDLRGRVPVGSGTGTGLTARTIGQTMGEETHTLTITEMPSHNHNILDNGHSHTPLSPATVFRGAHAGGTSGYATTNAGQTVDQSVGTGTSTTGILILNTGGGAAFNQMQPSLVLNYVIWAGTSALDINPDADISVTVVISFPTHTPTPTPTPTMTYTPGPSPTPTATVTATPNYIYRATVEVDGVGQDVGLDYRVTAGESIMTLLLFGCFVLLVILVAMKVIGERRNVG